MFNFSTFNVELCNWPHVTAQRPDAEQVTLLTVDQLCTGIRDVERSVLQATSKLQIVLHNIKPILDEPARAYGVLQRSCNRHSNQREPEGVVFALVRN